jgi:hypothetical protein
MELKNISKIPKSGVSFNKKIRAENSTRILGLKQRCIINQATLNLFRNGYL